jgi:outer membrane protein OmpA-like peptidoglycan-associated protein
MIISGLVCALALPLGLQAQDSDDNYVNITEDLGKGMELQEVADRAYENADEYWENVTGRRDGDDEELSAGEAVTEIYTNAGSLGNSDRLAKDIVNVTVAVVDSWPDCQDTFDAVRAAVELEPSRADEIVAKIAFKRDCNCNNGGLWLDQRVDDRLRVEMRHNILDVPFQCSCSQVAMYAGIAGLPENREWDDNMPDDEKAALIATMTERVTVITERTAAEQSLNSWECGCTDINIAASMQGIPHEEMRDGTFDGLAQKYAEEAGDTGLVVDSFGIVGQHPEQYWGDGEHVSQANVLRRKGEIHRGDNLLLDPFHPVTEFSAHGDRNHEHLGQHQHTSDNIPTDLFISEYVEGWNEEALQKPASEREPDERNRVVELYNGSDETIDLGNGQYFLEIYAGPGTKTSTVVTPPLLLKKTISLESDVTFEFDKADIKAEASEDLQKVVEALNEADIFSEIVIAGHTCDMGPDEYNLALSKRRADSVRDYLRELGLKDVEIRTEGLGESQPRLPNASEANRSRNRRVDITFVTREGEEIETSVAEADPGAPKKYEYTFLLPVPPTVHEVESTPAGTMAAGEYSEGDMSPRQVIGLNGAIEPGETFIIAYSESDDAIKDKADISTSQLDFEPNETLVLRRLGGDMALNCRAQSYQYVTNFPPVPFIRYPNPDPAPRPRPPGDEVASPN